MGKLSISLYVFIDKLAQCGHLILLLEGINVVLTSILLLCHISISPINFIFSLLFSIFCYLIMHKNEKNHATIIFITILIIILAIVLNGFIQDISYDGNWYHKFATGVLKKGWNPIYENINQYIATLKIPDDKINRTDLWITCYAKAVWYFDASVYAITNYIDSAKVFNIFTFIATFGICWNYFKQKVMAHNALILSIIFTGIPVSYSQLLTYYLDGALGQLLISSIIILLSISDDCFNKNLKKTQLVYLAFCIILCSNVKMTGLIFEAFFCGAFFIYWSIKQRKIVFNLFLYYLMVVSCSFALVGAGTYIKNIYSFGNPFYPIIGSDELDTSASLKSVGLETVSPFRQLMTMLFVRCSTDNENTNLEWKIPFTFKVIEFKKCCNDNNRGGGGVFFSGILCVSIIMFVFLIPRLYKSRKSELFKIFIIIGISILLMFIMPAGGMTRYSPYIYFLPNFTIYLLMLYLQDCSIKRKILNIICCFMCGITFINSFIFSEYILRGIIESIDYTHKYNEMKLVGTVYIDTELPGNLFNLIDRNIIYEYNSKIKYSYEMKYLWLKYEIMEN